MPPEPSPFITEAPPVELFILQKGSIVEAHSAPTLIDEVRRLMYSGDMRPGYSITKWCWIDGKWAIDDSYPADLHA